MMKVFLKIMLVVCLCAFTLSTIAAEKMVFKAGHKTLQVWLMPKSVPYPEGNKPTKSRVDLGKKLFFDPRLSGDGNMSCGSCHSPMFGWSDGLPTARGFRSVQLERATPTIVNSAFNSLQMWDGREKSLESQALGPMVSAAEMNVDLTAALDFLKGNGEYVHEFEKAYPGEGVTDVTLAKALASYERTVISNNSSFDKWVKGNRKAMTNSRYEVLSCLSIQIKVIAKFVIRRRTLPIMVFIILVCLRLLKRIRIWDVTALSLLVY